ncbi:MAG TPA: ABC transporter permease [Candidatus Mediterraneibacter surreyensis]|nr:ABC transporter permease [Candidatus Mediterraneibacter surreyensis]
MAVFKAYMRIAKKNMWMILMYLCIFLGVMVMFQHFAGSDTVQYAAQSVPVGIIYEDRGEAAESLIRYIGRTNEIVYLEDDRETLQENLFYRNVEYIVRIPRDFMEKCILGDKKLKVTTVPETYSGSYVEQQISNFINFARCYAAAGFTEHELGEAMAARETAKVEMLDVNGNGGSYPAYAFYYRYLPYLFLCVLCYVMGYILMGFRRGSLPDRMAASAVPARRQSMEGLMAAGVIAIALWGFCSLISIVFYNGNFLDSGKVTWYLLNSFVMLLSALALSYLIGSLVKTSNALNGIVNILSLGMCFACGVFVEMDLLSSGVRKAAQFLPVYWYETANEILMDYGEISGDIRNRLVGAIGIQLVFAAAFVCVTLAVAKKRQRSS